jgi:hypothetical protein
MNTLKTKTLAAAIAGVGALGAIGSAEAVYINPDGHGQVLIYPYYTVRSKVAATTGAVAPFQSLLSVVNTTASAKAVKVRFIEGKNSAEVLDFNLFLSAKDVWVAGVVPTLVGAGVFTPDTSCTVPTVSASAATPTPFVNFAYAEDAAGGDLDRTREGYVEIIEMGVVTGTAALAVTHTSAGKPLNCAYVADSTKVTIANPTGGLFGGMTLINVLAGEDFTAEAVALDQFRSTGKYDAPGDIKPDLQDVSPATAVIINGSTVITADAPSGFPIDAISALFMHDSIYNEFVLDTTTKSTTDWVLTMPTKRYYYAADGEVQFLFQRNFVSTGACDDVSLKIYDREEQSKTTPPGFSPPPPAGKPGQICWEATVMGFGAGNALGSSNRTVVATDYQNGWAALSFPTGASSVFDYDYHKLPMSNGTFIGLPVIGFAVQTFNNGTLTSGASLIQSQYGGNFAHKYSRVIQ